MHVENVFRALVAIASPMDKYFLCEETDRICNLHSGIICETGSHWPLIRQLSKVPLKGLRCNAGFAKKRRPPSVLHFVSPSCPRHHLPAVYEIPRRKECQDRSVDSGQREVGDVLETRLQIRSQRAA